MREVDEIAHLPLERQPLHELRPSLQLARNQGHRLDLLFDALAFVPERLGCEEALGFRHLLPEARRLYGGLGVGHGRIIEAGGWGLEAGGGWSASGAELVAGGWSVQA